MSDPTQEIPTVYYFFGDGALTLFGRPFQDRLPKVKTIRYWAPTTIQNKNGFWAVPFSLATTKGISIDFFSSVT